MNILLLITVAVIGIALGTYFASRKSVEGLISEQTKQKAENKERILEFLRNNKKVTNNNVEKLVKVSHATAERYLDELEKEEKLIQHGKIGQNVFYTLK